MMAGVTSVRTTLQEPQRVTGQQGELHRAQASMRIWEQGLGGGGQMGSGGKNCLGVRPRRRPLVPHQSEALCTVLLSETLPTPSNHLAHLPSRFPPVAQEARPPSTAPPPRPHRGEQRVLWDRPAPSIPVARGG